MEGGWKSRGSESRIEKREGWKDGRGEGGKDRNFILQKKCKNRGSESPPTEETRMEEGKEGKVGIGITNREDEEKREGWKGGRVGEGIPYHRREDGRVGDRNPGINGMNDI